MKKRHGKERSSHTSLGNGDTSIPSEVSFVIFQDSWVNFRNEFGILLEEDLPPLAKYCFSFMSSHGLKSPEESPTLREVNTYY